MKKIVKLRRPDGSIVNLFESTDDDWQPAAGHDLHLLDSLVGAGDYRVYGTRPVYSGKPACTDMLARYTGKVDQIYLMHVEVFVEAVSDGAAEVPVTRPTAHLPAHQGRNVKKIIKMRGPGGEYVDFFETGLDDWQPVVEQDFTLVDALHGAGWYTVAAARVVYKTSDAHTEISARMEGRISRVQVMHLEVFLEQKRLAGEEPLSDAAERAN